MHISSRLILSAALAAVFLGSLSSLAQAVDYVAIDLSPSGYTDSEANGICGNQIVGYGYYDFFPTGLLPTGLLWNDTAANPVNLSPYDESSVAATDGSRQVGYVSGLWGSAEECHAFLWNGSPDNPVDLHPSKDYFKSGAVAISGSQQVGYGRLQGLSYSHALLWNGSASSFVDLTPNVSGFAADTNGVQQVGNRDGHAVIWHGSATDYVDLHPYDALESTAIAIDDSQVVGWATFPQWQTPPQQHALLWNSSTTECTDLHPDGFTLTIAQDTNGTFQVGYGSGSPTGDSIHALLWNGSANSVVDLHQFLPSGFVESYARAINADGDIVGMAADALGHRHAMLWHVVPEPSTIILLGIGAFGLIACAWRRGRKAG